MCSLHMPMENGGVIFWKRKMILKSPTTPYTGMLHMMIGEIFPKWRWDLLMENFTLVKKLNIKFCLHQVLVSGATMIHPAIHGTANKSLDYIFPCPITTSILIR